MIGQSMPSTGAVGVFASAGLVFLSLACFPAGAVETSLQFVLTLDGDVERNQVRYQCEGREDLLTVEYVNAAPNFLAILPVEDEPLIFVTTVSASGARYVSGPWEWWNNGSEATLTDLMTPEDDRLSVACIEFVDTP